MFHICKAAVPHLQPGASIINTSSVNSDQPNPMLLAYAATKAAIANFSAGLAQMLGERGIRVNSVAPGPVWTPLIASTMSPDMVEGFGDNTPLGRPGQPVDLAPVYVMLASDEPPTSVARGSRSPAASRCCDMAIRCLRTVRRDEYWLNLLDGQQRPVSQHAYQGEAMVRGRELAEARGYQYVVEARHGTRMGLTPPGAPLMNRPSRPADGPGLRPVLDCVHAVLGGTVSAAVHAAAAFDAVPDDPASAMRT